MSRRRNGLPTSVERTIARRRLGGNARLSAGTNVFDEDWRKIKHIIVVMQENHSFDSYFGMLRMSVPDVDGFDLDDEGIPTHTNPRLDGTLVNAAAQSGQQRGLPTQSWNAAHEQWHGGHLNGFVTSGERLIPELVRSPDEELDAAVAMQYWDEGDLPFYYGLARTFPLIDRWFSSCLGPTFPNRRFLIAGTANGLIDDVITGLFDRPSGGTLFDLLNEAGIPWINYHHRSLFAKAAPRVAGAASLRAIRALGLAAAQLPGVGKFFSGHAVRDYLMSRMRFTANLYPIGLLGVWNHTRPLTSFFEDVASGDLPAVSIVDPDFELASEENPQDVRHGESFVAEVITKVMNGPKWPETLLIWTYDEHGGYFDHVDPPRACPPDDVLGRSIVDSPLGALSWFLHRFRKWRQLELADKRVQKLEPRRYDRYGFRVPAIVVSPYGRTGYISSRDDPGVVYDHTSILRTIELRWGLRSLTARDAAAEPLFRTLDLRGAPTFASPPPLPSPSTPRAAPESRFLGRVADTTKAMVRRMRR